MYPYSINGVIGAASNMVPSTDNPPYSGDDFLAAFPQFLGFIPAETLDMYVKLAHASVNVGRWLDWWQQGMTLFIAHWCTLYLQWSQNPTGTAAGVINAGMSKGLQASKSVDQVSVSYDFSTALQDLNGWAGWKLTAYGIQFATLGRIVGMGGMYVR